MRAVSDDGLKVQKLNPAAKRPDFLVFRLATATRPLFVEG
jgi:hypothetical protein